MANGVDCGNDNIGVGNFLRVDLDSWDSFLPKVPLSIFDFDLEIN